MRRIIRRLICKDGGKRLETNDFVVSRRLVLTAAMGFSASLVLPPAEVLAASPLGEFAPRGDGSVDHGKLTSLLAHFVKRDSDHYNRVDYKSFKTSGRNELASYIAALERVDPTTLSHDEAHAYWTNLYNAKTLDVVLGRYPVSSIKKINLGGGGIFGGGPWSKKLITVQGIELSLDDIEHRIVRPLFADPMSHYGLNCASYSCPNLATVSYTGQNIDSKLLEGASDYINHDRGLSISGGRITASKIYSWYANDFGGEDHLKVHWKQFATPELAAKIDGGRIGSYVYDWTLNDI